MKFYKAKWEASTPTKVQVNVPTNTDFMVGTELYVKGEKTNITAENVKLSDGSIIFTETSAVAPSGETEYWTSTVVSNKNTFTFKGNSKTMRLYANVKLQVIDGVEYAIAQDRDDLQIKTSSGTDMVNGGTANSVGTITIDGTTYSITGAAKNRIIGGKDGVWYYAIGNASGMVDYIDIPEGAVITSQTSWSPTAGTSSKIGSFNMRFRYPVVLYPDTEVNGIPAFTMKSLNAEADKLYDVEFKSEQDDVNVALSASSPMFNFLSATSSGYVYEATQDFTIEAPVYREGSEYIATDKPTKLKAFKTTGENWFDGTFSDPWNLVEVVVDGVKYAIMPTNKATFDYLGLTNNGDSYFYISNTSTYNWMEKVTVPAGTQVKFVGVQRLDGSLILRVARMLMGESYDYRFKLFINEDEQAYGDVQVGQEFENTITLSGTYEDDTTFSYTIPVVED